MMMRQMEVTLSGNCDVKYSYTFTNPFPETTRSTDILCFWSNFSLRNFTNPNSSSLRGANSA